MESYEINKIVEWLEITPQQFDILMTIYKLQLNGEDTTPRRIQEKYSSEYGKYMQRSNLFGQLRALLDRNYLKREQNATYYVNFDVLDLHLEEKREKLMLEVKEFDRISSHIKEYFQKVAFSEQRPRVFYMDYNEMMNSITRVTKSTYIINTTTYFPTISYTYQLAVGIRRAEYIKTLWKRCLENEELHINYITPLDVEFLFNHAFRVFGDPEKAYKESLIIIEELANQIDNYENLDIRYMRDLQGMDAFIPERSYVNEFFLFTRDEHKNLIGAIYINSRNISSSVKRVFMQSFGYAEKIRGRRGEEIIEEAENRLAKIYEL